MSDSRWQNSITRSFYSEDRLARAAEPRLFVIKGPTKYMGHSFALSDPLVSIGRKPDNTIALGIPVISAHHCQIRRVSERQFSLRDLFSRNGTLHNGRKVGSGETVALVQGDLVSLSGVVLLFVDPRSPGSGTAVNSIQVDFERAAKEAESILASFEELRNLRTRSR